MGRLGVKYWDRQRRVKSGIFKVGGDEWVWCGGGDQWRCDGVLMAGWQERGHNDGCGRSSPLEQLAQTVAKIGCGGGGGRNDQRRANEDAFVHCSRR